MFTEPLFFVILLIGVVPAVLYLSSREHRKELARFESTLRESLSSLLHKMELAVGARNQRSADQIEILLESTADRLVKSVDVLRVAIEHQARQQERLVDQLASIESKLSRGTSAASRPLEAGP